jgi:hypothetical protein
LNKRSSGIIAWRKVQLQYALRNIFADESGVKGDHEDDLDSKGSACITWSDLDRFVWMPENYYKLIWDFIVNNIYVVNILLSSSIVSFNMYTYEYFFTFEYIIDWIVFIDMVFYFFTAFENINSDAASDNSKYNKSLKQIMRHYLCGYFIFDFIACMPVLIA